MAPVTWGGRGSAGVGRRGRRGTSRPGRSYVRRGPPEQLRLPWQRFRCPWGGGSGRCGRFAGGVEQDRRDVHAGDPVHEGVVGLGDQREATSRHALHQPYLPEGLGTVQALGEDAAREALQGLLAGRLRKRGVADVVVGVEVGVVGPHRASLAEGDVRQALAIAGDQVQSADDVVDQFLEGRSLTLEDHHRGHVHVGSGVVLQVQERGIEGRQAVGVRHTAILAGFQVRGRERRRRPSIS